MSRPHIRWMIRRDMPEVYGIEWGCFDPPQSDEEIITKLRQRSTIGMVAEVDQAIHGFMIYSLHKSWVAVSDFAVHPLHRNQGVGTAMIQKLISKLSMARRTHCEICVDLDSSEFFANRGFYAVELLAEDWVRMQLWADHRKPVFVRERNTVWKDSDDNEGGMKV